MKINDDVKWIIGVILGLLIGYLLYSSFTTRNIMRWFLVMLSFLGVGIVFHAFAGIFTKNNLKKWVATLLLIILCIFIYKQTHKESKVIYMQEDVLYIQPRSDTLL